MTDLRHLATMALAFSGACTSSVPITSAIVIDENAVRLLALTDGVDLLGPVATPVASQPPPRQGKTLDLDVDRALTAVSVPALPRGGSAALDLSEGRTGWATRIPDSLQLPAAAYGDGKIYISGGFDSVSFYGLHATTGKIEWATTNLEDNGPTAAIYEDDKVIFNTESCTLFALDAKTGKRLWFKYLGDPTLAQVAVRDGLVFAGHPNGDSGAIVLSAFKVKNGSRVWTRTVGGELLATPVISGDSVYAATIHGVLYRFERSTGKRVWRQRLGATTAPWIVGDEIFIARRTPRAKGSTARGEEQVVLAADTGEVIRTAHASAGRYLGDVPRNLESWRKVWAFEGSRPVVAHGVRYVAMGGEIHATDAATGTPLWVRRYAPAADKRSVGTVAIAGPQIVISTRGGQLYGLDIDTGYTLWAYDLDTSVIAQPIVARGWIYVTTEKGYVLALQVADESLDGWHMFGGNPSHNGPTS